MTPMIHMVEEVLDLLVVTLILWVDMVQEIMTMRMVHWPDPDLAPNLIPMILTIEKDLLMIPTTRMEEKVPTLTKMTQILWVDVVQEMTSMMMMTL